MKAGIAGAGVLGRLLALRLLQAGWSVTVFDDNAATEGNNCSMAAAGLLTPITELERNDPLIFALGQASLASYWPAILRQLEQPIYFQALGSLVLAHPRDFAELTRFIGRVAEKLPPNNLHYQPVSAAEIAALEPDLTQFNQGYYFPLEGNLDNQTLLCVLGNFLRRAGVQWYVGTAVQQLRPNQIFTAEKEHTFDWVFDCRGLGAKAHFPELRGVRGELLWLQAPTVRIRRPVRLLNPRYSLYIAPRPDDIYIVGASEIESEDQSPIAVRTVLELLSSACYLHSGFSEARLIKTCAQLRPTLADNLPKIKVARQLIAVNGLYRHGFLIAPALVEEIYQYIEGGAAACQYSSLWECFDANFFK
jgi:glycine oxidase